MTSLPRLSVVIPLFNEEAVLPELLRQVGAVLAGIPGGPHEMVLVDDGSSDGTTAQLEAAAARDPTLVCVILSRNFGHQAAISAGLDTANGDVIVVMDGDLQDAPTAIPAFLAEHAKGYDVVYARRVRRKEGLILRTCYALFYRLMARLSDVAVPLDAGDFALMSRRVVTAIRSSPERKRYLRGLRTWVGFRQVAIDVERGPRFAGEAKYSTIKLFQLAFDGIFSFSLVPLRLATVLGLFAMVSSLAFVVYAIYARVMLNTSPEGFTALLVALVFLSGVQLFFLGVIGEYVGRAYEEAKRRPLYVVRSLIGRS
mgnify:CR=1 FL=1|jgi:glycosyltransferase involved in cell wall biosynthesis